MKRRSSLVLLCVSLLLTLSVPCWSWWPTGHEIIAQIAYNNMTSNARKHSDRLLAVPLAWPEVASSPEYMPTPLELTKDLYTFVLAAPWADALKDYQWKNNAECKAYSSLHYIGIPTTKRDRKQCPGLSHFINKAKLTIINTNNSNVVSAIRSSIKTLVSRESQTKKEIALRFLIHFVGDVHMPFHATGPLFSYKGHLFSTNGANLIFLSVPIHEYPHIVPSTELISNFHAFWDAGVEAYYDIPGPANYVLTPFVWEKLWKKRKREFLRYIGATANGIDNEYQGVCQNQKHLAITWAAESAQLGCQLLSSSYINENQFKPFATGYSDAPFAVKLVNFDYKNYEKHTQSLALKQIYLAGIRLAGLLNAIYAPWSAKTDPAYVDYVNYIRSDDSVLPLDELIDGIIEKQKL